MSFDGYVGHRILHPVSSFVFDRNRFLSSALKSRKPQKKVARLYRSMRRLADGTLLLANYLLWCRSNAICHFVNFFRLLPNAWNYSSF